MKEDTKKSIIFFLLCLEWFVWVVGSITSLVCIFTQSISPLIFLATLIGGSAGTFVFTVFYKLLGTVEELKEDNENLHSKVEILSDKLDNLDYELSRIRSKYSNDGNN